MKKKIRISAKGVIIEQIYFAPGEYDAQYGNGIVQISHPEGNTVELEIDGGVDTSFYNEFIEVVE